MPMVQMQAGDQTIRFDREATATIYAAMKSVWAEHCGCAGCRNLIAQRDKIYPSSFASLLDRLGVDIGKEAESVAGGPVENGLHHYEGWFYFVGEMVTAGEQVCGVTESPYFGHFFTRVGPCPKEFLDGPHLAVEFIAHIGWVLDESWDSDPSRSRVREGAKGRNSGPSGRM